MENWASQILQLCALAMACYGLHLFVVLVHEAGHAIAAQLLGFQNSRFEVGPFQIDQKDGFQFRLRWNRLLNGAVTAQFRTIPHAGGVIRALGFVVAGPVFSAILSWLAGLLSPPEGIISEIVGFVIVDSALVGILTLIPARVGTRTTDGHKVISLLFSRIRRRQLLFSLSLQARLLEMAHHYNADNFPELLRAADDLILHTKDHFALSGDLKWMEALEKMRTRAIAGRGEPANLQVIAPDSDI